jgi:hypothetical protein
MKIRILAVCLLICLVFSGCGTAAPAVSAPTTLFTTPYDPEDDGPTTPFVPEPEPTAPVGAILEVPDAAAHPDSMKQYEQYRLEIVDALGFHFVYAYRYTFATNEMEYYILDEYNDEETIWYVHGEEKEQYVRGLADAEFVCNTYWDGDTAGADFEEFANTVNIFLSYSAPAEDTHYVKMGETEVATGPAYGYEVYYKNQLDHYILIDKASGILVQKVGTEKEIMLLVTTLDLANAGIPEYK